MQRMHWAFLGGHASSLKCVRWEACRQRHATFSGQVCVHCTHQLLQCILAYVSSPTQSLNLWHGIFSRVADLMFDTLPGLGGWHIPRGNLFGCHLFRAFLSFQAPGC